MKTPKKVIHVCPMPEVVNNKWVIKYDRREVRLMVIVEGYAMVRRPNAMPYVAALREIELLK